MRKHCIVTKTTIFLFIGCFVFFPSCSQKEDITNALEITFQAPSDLSVSRIGQTAVRLSWQDNSNSEESFAVERKVNQGLYVPRVFAVRNVTTAVDSSELYVDSLYSYRVRALRFTESSDYSNVVSIQLTLPFP